MSATISETAVPSAPYSFGRVLGAGLFVAIGATLVNVVVFMLARDLLDIPFVFPYQGAGSAAAPLPVAFVIVASMLGALAAALLLAVLGRMTRRPLRIFQIVGITFLIVSFGGPLSLPVGLPTKLVLSAMHIMAAVIIIAGLTIRLEGRASRQPRSI